MIDLIESAHRHLGVVGGKEIACFFQQLRANTGLLAEDALHTRLLCDILSRRGALRRSGNNQRRTRLVNQNTVHFVNNGKGVSALHHLRGVSRHTVVTQIVKAEFTIGAISDITGILCAAFGGRHRILNAPNRQSQVGKQMPHELRIAPGQIIIDRYQMCRSARKCIQIERERRHQRLTLTGLHFGDFTLMQHDAADQLHIKRQHIPR